MLRSIFGCLIAPFPAALIQSLVVALWPKEGMGVFEHPASIFVAVCLYFYACGLVLGGPLRLALRKRRSRKMSSFALAGLAVALTPAAFALAWTVLKGQVSAYVVIYNVLYFAVGGALAGALFWFVTKPNRPAATVVASSL